MQCRGDRWDQEQVEGVNVLNIRRVGVERHVSLKKWKMAKMTLVSHSDSFLRFAVVNSHLDISRWQDLGKPLWNIGKVIQVERESQLPDPNENCTLFVFTFSELIVEGNSVLIHLKSRWCFPVFPTEWKPLGRTNVQLMSSLLIPGGPGYAINHLCHLSPESDL